MVKSLMIDFCGCSTKWLSFRKAIKLNAKPCPQGASPSYQVCPQQQPVLANEAIMRCQLGFHDQSKKRLVLFFQEKSAVFSKTVSWAGESPSPEEDMWGTAAFLTRKASLLGVRPSARGSRCGSGDSPGCRSPIQIQHEMRPFSSQLLLCLANSYCPQLESTLRRSDFT